MKRNAALAIAAAVIILAILVAFNARRPGVPDQSAALPPISPSAGPPPTLPPVVQPATAQGGDGQITTVSTAGLPVQPIAPAASGSGTLTGPAVATPALNPTPTDPKPALDLTPAATTQASATPSTAAGAVAPVQ